MLWLKRVLGEWVCVCVCRDRKHWLVHSLGWCSNVLCRAHFTRDNFNIYYIIHNCTKLYRVLYTWSNKNIYVFDFVWHKASVTFSLFRFFSGPFSQRQLCCCLCVCICVFSFSSFLFSSFVHNTIIFTTGWMNPPVIL